MVLPSVLKHAFFRLNQAKLLVTASTAVLCLVFACGAAAGSASKSEQAIKLNQLGYLPQHNKVAIVPESAVTDFEIIDAISGRTVFSNKLGPATHWSLSNERVHKADFSRFNKPGQYRIKVDKALSYQFQIGQTALHQVHKASLKSFYLNRAGIAIQQQYGGEFKRDAGHSDTKVAVHQSAATETRPKGTLISAPKGWYDAGDYGKYIVNSGISTYTLLLAYQQFPHLYNTLSLNIPESDNSVPDLLDEIKWNLDWMEAMQDLDGGVYHKLTALQFSGMSVQPKDENSQRWVIGKSVTATLDFAAVMATASRVFNAFDTEFPGASARYQRKAMAAYAWAKQHPKALYQQPSDVGTGAYDDDKVNDEFAWAAAELFLLTGDKAYLTEFKAQQTKPDAHLTWSEVSALAYVSLLEFGQGLLTEQDYTELRVALMAAAKQHAATHQASPYNIAMTADDFKWGSNSSALNNGLVLFQAYRISDDQVYKQAAISSVDYVLGTNATGYSFVTGYGHKTPMDIHHRPSVSDAIDAPVPGFIAGGPHTGRQDKCDYPGDLPATNYADIECSYSTNEIAINWNAPLVYMLGAAISTQ